jgi:NTE family protein
VILGSLFVSVAAMAAEPESRPRVVLVLSGGGARGAAHVGVLRVLEEARIPVDAVVGTSMGSVVGGLYAAGMGPDELETALVETDWMSVFTTKPPRNERYFRRKEDDAEFLVRYKVHFRDGKPRLPMGLLQAQKLANLLKFYEITRSAATDFDALPIPFRAVATDLDTGGVVVLDHGSLATAMRASMGIPALFPPVPVGDRLLVDGGVSANLPIEVARALDADVVIAVDIGTPLAGKERPESYLGVILRLSDFLTEGNVERSKAELGAQDILIEPDLGDISVQDFDRIDDAIEIGEKAAREALDQLRSLGVGDDTWADWTANHHRAAPELPVVAGIRVNNSSPVTDRIVLGQLNVRIGQPLDIDRLMTDLSRLYGLEYFEPISFDVEPGPDGVVVVVNARRRSTGLTTAQFGIELEDDFQGGNGYVVQARLQRIAVNRYAGEWRVDVRLGERAGARFDFFQPIDARLHWFVSPEVFFEQEQLLLTRDGDRVAQILVDDYGVGLAVGRNLARWGQARLGLRRNRVDGEVIVPEGFVDPVRTDVAAWYATLAYDTLDSPAWPRSGGRGLVEYTDRFPSLGGEQDNADLEVRATWAWSLGRNTFVPGAEFGLATDEGDEASGFTLGGVFQLSGLEPNELIGQEYVLGRIVFYREFNRRRLRLIQPGWYIGASLEAGNVFTGDEPITTDELIGAGSIFLGADTVIGPIQLGWGYAEGGRSRVYLTVGRSYF